MEEKVISKLDKIINLLEKQNSLLQSVTAHSMAHGPVGNMAPPPTGFGTKPDVKSMIEKARAEAQARIKSSGNVPSDFKVPDLNAVR